jgi:pimeloyl-ACP methyl ester carboxylesterase
MVPWALRLAQDGWQCVLVDLRGHGKSTGPRIYFGLQEVKDLSQQLDELTRDGRLKAPVAVMGESYGAALALRWKAVEPRVQMVVAIAPYAGLSNAVMNLREEYADWLPKTFIKVGLKQLPVILKTNAAELDTTTEMARCPMRAYFVAGAEDKIAPVAEVKKYICWLHPAVK